MPKLKVQKSTKRVPKKATIAKTLEVFYYLNIHKNKFFSSAELREKFELNRKQIYRVIKQLELSGVPIEVRSDNGKGPTANICRIID